MSICRAYLTRETLKVFILFLASFYFLYGIVDYTMHLQEIVKNHQIPFWGLAKYYVMLFSKRCDLLIPLALLIATTKVLLSCNQKKELLALQTAGIPLYRLMQPLFIIALSCTGLSYLNLEYISPKSGPFLNQFERAFLKKNRTKKVQKETLSTLPLEDGSELIYLNYDPYLDRLDDVFHVHSENEIWHIKTLSLSGPEPIGYFVDKLVRDSSNVMEKIASYDTYTFSALKVDFTLKETLKHPVENQAISNLIAMKRHPNPMISDGSAGVATHLYYKLVTPWLSVLVVLGIAPFCVSHGRNLPSFMIFSLGIFGYIALFTMMDTSVILGETGVIPPFWAILTLPLVLFILFGSLFTKKLS